MIQLSDERIEQILHQETFKTEPVATILRSIWLRYMRTYEKYFTDFDTLTEADITRMRKDHEETISLVKIYYMDIPQDTCTALKEFDKQYTDKLLGPEWRKVIDEGYKEFKAKSKDQWQGEKALRAEFIKENLDEFYDDMGYVFRESLGTGSKTVNGFFDGIKGLLFGKSSKDK